MGRSDKKVITEKEINLPGGKREKSILCRSTRAYGGLEVWGTFCILQGFADRESAYEYDWVTART